MEKHRVHFQWIRGHAGHAENERCDRLAVQAASKDNLPEDKRA
jgi:ribonuclease HI